LRKYEFWLIDEKVSSNAGKGIRQRDSGYHEKDCGSRVVHLLEEDICWSYTNVSPGLRNFCALTHAKVSLPAVAIAISPESKKKKLRLILLVL
jgi:hypothetical protein